MEPTWITGRFRASFSTRLMADAASHDTKWRHVEWRGRLFLSDAQVTNGRPMPNEGKTFFQYPSIKSVEIQPFPNQPIPLDIALRQELFEVLITEPQILHEQDLDGVRHGVLTGVLYGRLGKPVEPPVVTQPIAASSIDEPLVLPEGPIVAPLAKRGGCLSRFYPTRASSISTGMPLANRNGCLGMTPGLGSASPGCMPGAGCLPAAGCLPGMGCLSGRGCLSLLWPILLLGILLALIKTCTEYVADHRERQGEEQLLPQEEDDKVVQERIEERDSSAVIDDKTVRKYQTVSLPKVQFYTGNAQLIPSSLPELQKLAVYLLQNEGVRAKIIGHTDNQGDPAKNLQLSQQRAEAVRLYLISQGVPAERLQAEGLGASQPITENLSEEGRLMNRRVEIELSDIESLKP